MDRSFLEEWDLSRCDREVRIDKWGISGVGRGRWVTVVMGERVRDLAR